MAADRHAVEPDPIGFDQLELAPAVLQALDELGYEAPTAIQSQCLPPLLAGRDLLGQAQTGTGKTAAFALPLLSRIDLALAAPQALVLAPTRELALQVAEAFQRYARHLPGFHVLPLYGGQGYAAQIRQLRRGAHVIVGTPGRVMDHLRRGTLELGAIRTLVLDEADEMLNMGFAEDIEWIFDQAPPQRQVALFSATLPAPILRVARARLRDPAEIRVSARSETVDTIAQSYCLVSPHHKLDVLNRLLEVEAFDAMLVFVRTKNATLEVAEKLVAHGFAAEALNGDLSQQARERIVERLRDGRLDIVVATDVAARGLDVPRISHVVNYDIPTEPESYVHRIGRTGRAGRSGRALSFVQPRERRLLSAIEKTIGRTIDELQPPSADALSARRIERFSERLRDTLSGEDLDFFYQLVVRLAKQHELDVLDIAAALAYLQQRERPLAVQPIPAPVRGEAGRASPATPRRQRKGGAGGDRPGTAGAKRHHRGAQEPAESRDPEVAWVGYRLEVGRQDGVTPREIVGAIANEAGLEGRYIGRIDIRDDHSMVDLPDGMPHGLEQLLRKVRVCGRPLNLRRSRADTRRGPGVNRPPRPRARTETGGPPKGSAGPGGARAGGGRSSEEVRAPRAQEASRREFGAPDPRDPRQSFKRKPPLRAKRRR